MIKKLSVLKQKLNDEPLWLFIIISPIIYVVLVLVKPLEDIDKTEITKEELIGRIAQTRQLSYQQAKTYWLKMDEEVKTGIKKQFINNKLLSYKAFELGLHSGDTVIEGRLSQKMRMLILRQVIYAKPSKEELETFYTENIDFYKSQARYSFSYTVGSDVKFDALPAKPLENVTYENPDVFFNVSQEESKIQERFGKKFIKELALMKSKRWSGPVESNFGKHWVYITAEQPPLTHKYNDVEAQVIEDWRHIKNEESIDRYIKRLKKQYHYLIDAEL
jgi:hypothetical protein